MNKYIALLTLLIHTSLLHASQATYTKYIVNTGNSKINWEGSKPTGQHYGTVDLMEGYIIFQNGKLTDGKFVIDFTSIVNLDIESIQWNTKLVDHLKSEDFFHVEKYPQGTFEISNVQERNENEYRVTGFLTLKDVSKSISFTVRISQENEGLKVVSDEIILDRTQWNMEAMSKSLVSDLKDNYVDDEMKIDFVVFAE